MVLLAQLHASTPKTAQDLSRLVEQRDELRGQLEQANNQRGQIAEQIQRLGDPEARAGLFSRLKAADTHIGELSRDIQTLDNAITDAKANGVNVEPGSMTLPDMPNVPSPPMMPGFNWTTEPAPWRDRFVDSLGVTAPITLASVVLVGVLIYWRISRSVKAQIARLQATQTGALMQLQQSLDSVAVEIERVSENQRFVTKLVGEKPKSSV